MPWRMDQQGWTSESQCGHHCLAALLLVGLSLDQQHHMALGNQTSLLMKHNSDFKKTPLGCVCGLIFSLLPCLCSYPGSVHPQPQDQESNPAFSKPCIQQTHSVLEFHLVTSYFWDIVALDLGGCEVQKDTGTLAMELNRPGRGMAASSSLPGNAHTEVHSDCCGGPSTV